MIGCVATVNAEEVYVAVPELPTVTVARTVVPALNVTVPVGMVVPCEIVAVSVTDWPNTDGFAEEVTTVVVPFSTTSVSALDALATK
jgi:hypothetical protein